MDYNILNAAISGRGFAKPTAGQLTEQRAQRNKKPAQKTKSAAGPLLEFIFAPRHPLWFGKPQ